MTTFTTDDRKSAINAYKLADELEGFGYLNSDDGLHFCPFQAQVDMLRQQQAEITALRKQLISATNALMEKR